MTFHDITQKISQKITMAPDIKGRIKFDLKEEGVIYIDTTQSPPLVSNEDGGDADVTLTCSMDTFQALLSGAQDPNIAFMMGKLKVKGNMALAMKLNAVLED